MKRPEEYFPTETGVMTTKRGDGITSGPWYLKDAVVRMFVELEAENPEQAKTVKRLMDTYETTEPEGGKQMDREQVAEAMAWGDKRPQYIISPDSLADRDMYHDADDVEKHVKTLAELVTMQHEALSMMFELIYDAEPGDRQLVADVLALMPTKEDTHDD